MAENCNVYMVLYKSTYRRDMKESKKIKLSKHVKIPT